MKSKPGGDVARPFEEPEIECPALGIGAGYDYSLLIGRQSGIAVRSRRADRSQLLARAVEPHELGRANTAAAISQHAIVRYGKRGQAGLCLGIPNLLGNGNGVTGKPRGTGIEGLRHQSLSAQEEYVAGLARPLCVYGAPIRAEQALWFLGAVQ